MNAIKITDEPTEKEKIGRELFAEKRDIYDERRMRMLHSTIDKFYPDCTAEEKERIFYLSLYDYWVYGATLEEYHTYDFASKTHEQKSKYLTFWSREEFFEHLNKGAERHLLSKYEAYCSLKEFYKRDIILLSEDNFAEFDEFVTKHPRFVVKPLNLQCAEGVHFDGLKENETKQEAFGRLLGECAAVYKNVRTGVHRPALVLEEPIKQHEALGIFHPSTVNGVRMTAIRVDGKVKFFYPWIKIGVGNTDIVCGAIDGMVAGINADTGIIETDGRDKFGRVYERHPDTGIKLKGYAFPQWEELKATVTAVSDRMPMFGYVGWDMVLTDNGWVVMEGNDWGAVTGQMLWNKGLKKELEEMIHWQGTRKYFGKVYTGDGK